jgi:MFS-type transporter involved in bile tolerance (Atg22 family)
MILLLVLFRKKGYMKKELVFAFSLIGRVGIVTAAPAVGFAFLGHYLDMKFQTSPKLLIICMAIALAVSLLSLKKIVTDVINNQKDN